MFTPSDSDSEHRSRSPPTSLSRKPGRPLDPLAPHQLVEGVQPPGGPNPSSLPSSVKGPSVATWAAHILEATKESRAGLGAQLRPLIIHGGFSGIGSHARVLQETGVDFKETASAEPKEHAKRFLSYNGLLAEHHYDDLQTVTTGSPAHCACCHGICHPPPDRPDLFLAGFSCQPFSKMRQKTMKATPPSKHAKFNALALLVEYCIRRQPRLVVLENTKGFGHEMEIDGRKVVGCQWLQDKLSSLYYTSWVALDSKAWVNVRRPRLWIFLVHKDTGSQRTADLAVSFASQVQAHRSQGSPDSLQTDYMLQPGTPEWEKEVLAGQAGSLEPRKSNSCFAKASWLKQAEKMRAKWRAEGFVGSEAHPLASAALRGLRGTDREREVLEVFLIAACLARGVCPLDEASTTAVKAELTADVSQNLVWLRPEHGEVAGVFCTESRVYSFRHDRLVLPQEQLAAMGWQDPGKPATRPSVAGLSSTDIQDLVGECQALPCLAAAIWGILLAANTDVPRLWAGRRPQSA